MARRGQETPENTQNEKISTNSSSVMRFFPSTDFIESIDGFWNKKSTAKGGAAVNESLPIRRITLSPSVNSRSSVSRDSSLSKRNSPAVRRITVANKNDNDSKTSPTYSPLSPKQKELIESLHSHSSIKKEYIKRLSVQVETDRKRVLEASKFKGFMSYSPSAKKSHELRKDRAPNESIHSYLYRAGNNTKIRKEKLRRNSMLDQHVSIELSKFKEVGFMPYSPSVKMKQSHAHSAPGESFLVKLYNYDTIWSALKHQKLQEMKELIGEQRAQEEMKECTFHPQLIASSPNFTRNRVGESKDDIFICQYNHTLKMQESLKRTKASYDDELYRVCTFKPNINKSSIEIANRRRKELMDTYGESESKSVSPADVAEEAALPVVEEAATPVVEEGVDRGLKRVGIVYIDDSDDDEAGLSSTVFHEGSTVVEAGEDLLNRSQLSQSVMAVDTSMSSGAEHEESVDVEVGEDLLSRSYVSQIENADSNYVDVTGYCVTPASAPKPKQNSSKLSVDGGFSVFEYLHNIGNKRSQDIKSANIDKHTPSLSFAPTMYTNSSMVNHRNRDTHDRLYNDYARQLQSKEEARERARAEREALAQGSSKKMDRYQEKRMVHRLADVDLELRKVKSANSRQESQDSYIESVSRVKLKHTVDKTEELLRQRVVNAIEAIFMVLLETVVYTVYHNNKNVAQAVVDGIRGGDSLDLVLAKPMMLSPAPLSTHMQTALEKISAATGRTVISKNRFIEFINGYILEQSADARELHALLRHTHKIYNYNRGIDRNSIHNRVVLPHEIQELKKCTFTPKLVSKQLSKTSYTNLLQNISTASETSAEDIQHLVAYIKGSCGSSVGGHTEEILLPELEAAYRKLKQVVMLEDKNQLGKKLFLRFKELLDGNKMTPIDFFRRFDTRGSLDYTGGDGKLSPMELRDGINRLCDSSGLPRWKHTEYTVLVRYMDPNADGDITEEELLGAFERIEDTETEDSIKRLIPIVLQLEQMMVSKKMRMKDLFMSIDTDKSGTVSLEELQQALLDIVPSHNELASNRLHERSRASHDRMAMISMREQEELKECTFKPQLVSKQTFTDVLLNISAASETSAEDIQHLVAYIKGSCGSSGGSHTEEILLPELEAAYRKLKQVVMLEDKNQLGKKLFLRFKDLLNSLSLSPAQFFRRFDTRGSLDYTGGDGKLSPMELRDGINRLCDSSGLPRWKHTEYTVLVRYMDPNADGDITEEELLGAFERIEDTETEDSIKRLIPIVLQLEQMMVSKKMRMKDLFMSIDTDKSGTVSLEELQQALLDIVPSHNELASNRLHERSYAIHEGITSSALREQEELKECTFKPQLSSKHSYQSLLYNLSTAKATTYEDIQHLVAYIKGSCGSGGGSHTEEILLPELEAAYRKLRQVVLMDEEKTRQGRNRPSLQLSKDASPVAAEVTKRLVPIVLHLEKIMITKKMRIKDLFMQIDTDKSGSVSADELSHALREILV